MATGISLWFPSHGNNSKKSHDRQCQIFKEKAKLQWEKIFCRSNGVDSKRLSFAKKFLSAYPDFAHWDDSAGRTAFENAKARYLAEINGVQPETSLPDQNMFIDEVDFDAPPSDPKLCESVRGSLSDDEYEEDECEDDCACIDWEDGGVILLAEHYSHWRSWIDMDDDHPIVATGWVD